MVDLVEAGFDVALHDPLVVAWYRGEEANLGHGVMRSAHRAEPVAAREKVRLEDRLQHQLQRRLDHPVGDRGDPQPAQLAARLGDHPLLGRQRLEAALPQRGPQPVQELLAPDPRDDGRRCLAVHPGGLGALVAPHPLPRPPKERGIGHEVEQVVEHATRLLASPTVQLGLDPQYPALRPEQGGLQLVGVHQRLLAFQRPYCVLAGPLRPASGSPGPHGGSSRPRLLRGLRPIRRPTAGDRRTVPTFAKQSIGQGGAQLYSGSIATPTPQTFSVASPPLELHGFGVDHHQRWSCALHTGPYPPDLSRLRCYGASSTGSLALHLLTSPHGPVPSGSPDTSRPCRGRLPPSPALLRVRLPPGFTRPLRRPSGNGLSPLLDCLGASWRTAPSRRKPRPP